MSAVWSAHDLATGQEVAVKFPANSSAEEQRRFAAEAEFTRILDHPNITRGLDHGTDPQPYLTMEKVHGHTLDHVRTFRGAMAPHAVVSVGTQIARALEAVHAAGLLHRDVHPGNVMVTPDGTAKLLDFGLATYSDPREPSVTPDHIMAQDYAAPERLRPFPHRERGTPESDLYSLGVVLHNTATGNRLFRSPIPGLRPPSLRAVATDVPRELSDLVEELLQEDPADRPSSARHVAERLETASARLEASRQAPSQDQANEQSAAPSRSPEQQDLVAAALAGLEGVSAVISHTTGSSQPPSRPQPRVDHHRNRASGAQHELNRDREL